MKILIDQNISFRLIQKIESVFSDISHVKYCDLMDANDFDIFIYAKNNQFKAILTLDEDFDNILLEHKASPKVIWLRAILLRQHLPKL
jgi:predicted nuclease of predicted toxin-antitoxin system